MLENKSENPQKGLFDSMKINTTQERYARLEGSEIESLREERAKHYDLGRGRRQAVMFSAPVHYRDKDGKLREIDNNLILEEENGRKVYRNTAGEMRIEIPAVAGPEGLAKISAEGHRLAWRLEGSWQSAAEVRNGDELLKAERVRRAVQFREKMAGRMKEEASKLAEAKVLGMKAILESCKGFDFAEPVLTLKSALAPAQEDELNAFVDAIAASVGGNA